MFVASALVQAARNLEDVCRSGHVSYRMAAEIVLDCVRFGLGPDEKL